MNAIVDSWCCLDLLFGRAGRSRPLLREASILAMWRGAGRCPWLCSWASPATSSKSVWCRPMGGGAVGGAVVTVAVRCLVALVPLVPALVPAVLAPLLQGR